MKKQLLDEGIAEVNIVNIEKLEGDKSEKRGDRMVKYMDLESQ